MTDGRGGGAFRRALSSYRPRNARLVDVWSFVHLATCAALALAFGPLIAFVLALAWEPVEVLVLSPLLARHGIDFGHEDLRNSLSDIAFNATGVMLGYVIAVLTGYSPPLAPF